MLVAVRYKNEIRDADVIECGYMVENEDRLRFYRHIDTSGAPIPESRFLSIALDQIAIWEIINSPDDLKVPEPDDVVRVPIHSDTYQFLMGGKGQYSLGMDGAQHYVGIPVFKR